QLVLYFDRRESRRLREPDGTVNMHRIAPTAAGIENDGQPTDSADIDRDLCHLRQRDIGFGYAFEPAERPSAHVDRPKTCVFGNPRHDRIERARSDDQLIAPNEVLKIRQSALPDICCWQA